MSRVGSVGGAGSFAKMSNSAMEEIPTRVVESMGERNFNYVT